MKNPIRKIILSIIFLSFIHFGTVNATWYNAHTVTFTNPGSLTLPTVSGGGPNLGTSCDTDSDASDPKAVVISGSPTVLTDTTPPPGPLATSPSGNMTCLYWDPTNPTVTVEFQNTYATQQGWTNQDTNTLKITLGDLGGSKLKSYVIYQSNTTDVQGLTGWSARGASVYTSSNYATSGNNTSSYNGKTSDTPTFAVNGLLSGHAYKYKVVAYDWVNNNTTSADTSIIRIDKIVPKNTDITFTDIINNNPTHLLADSSYEYTVSINNGGLSPIVSVDGAKENSSNQLLSNFSDTNPPWTQTWDISNVDDFRTIDGNSGRQFTFRVTRICDQAGNCSTGPQDFYHNVYANTNRIYGIDSNSGVTTNDLVNSLNVADGTTKNVTITLKDTYGNIIIPANGISRTIDYKFTYNNSMYLNQHDVPHTGNSVFSTTPNDGTFTNKFPISSNAVSFDGMGSNNGNYNFGFKVYTPTANSYLPVGTNGPVSDSGANFNFSIQFKVNGNIGDTVYQDVIGSAITSKFSPLYYTKITGDLDNGFINNATQQSTIVINKKGVKNPTGEKLLFDFGGTDSPKFNMYHTLSDGCITALTPIGTLTDAVTNPSFPLTTTVNNLCTNMVQKPGVTVGTHTSTYLSTHISYTLDGHSVLYNSDIVGKPSFNSGTTTPTTVQAGIKTTGITSSANASFITDNQSSNEINLVGNNSKSGNGALLLNQKVSSKTEIRKNATNFAKNVSLGLQDTLAINKLNGDTNYYGKTINYGTDSSVVYFNLLGGVVTLDDSFDSIININGKRTILVIGGDLYIKSNLYYNNNSTDILGVIVMKNSAGVGGNIFIHPSVTNLAGTFYADKSIFSSKDGIHGLGAGTTISDLKNQLYIYGSVMSENTLGGSTQSPAKCPAYITPCTDPQKYDLNFLRRYYIVPADALTGAGYPFSQGKVSGGGYWDSTKSFHNGSLNSFSTVYKITSTSNKYYSYPLIIDYNSKILSNPPPLFKLSK